MHEPPESVAVTHPEKVLFPDSGITKGDVCGYYADVAPVMLPHVRQRPVTMERYPAGIDKKGFIQKDVVKGFPAWLERVEVARRDEKTGGVVHYPLANDARALVWLANQNSVTPHVWTARAPQLDHADLCVFDLDPPEEGSDHLAEAALCVRDLLGELALPAFVKTSGAKGFHIVVAVEPETDFGDVFRFSRGAGAVLVKRRPDLFTQEFIKSDRGGRIFVDTGRNAPGATFAAVYAVRAKPGAPVATPLAWEELSEPDLSPSRWTLRDVPGRLDERGDPWAGIAKDAAALPR
jgi:bifunctional non-homologous end joining protein LigD